MKTEAYTESWTCSYRAIAQVASCGHRGLGPPERQWNSLEEGLIFFIELTCLESKTRTLMWTSLPSIHRPHRWVRHTLMRWLLTSQSSPPNILCKHIVKDKLYGMGIAKQLYSHFWRNLLYSQCEKYTSWRLAWQKQNTVLLKYQVMMQSFGQSWKTTSRHAPE